MNCNSHTFMFQFTVKLDSEVKITAPSLFHLFPERLANNILFRRNSSGKSLHFRYAQKTEPHKLNLQSLIVSRRRRSFAALTKDFRCNLCHETPSTLLWYKRVTEIERGGDRGAMPRCYFLKVATRIEERRKGFQPPVHHHPNTTTWDSGASIWGAFIKWKISNYLVI